MGFDLLSHLEIPIFISVPNAIYFSSIFIEFSNPFPARSQECPAYNS